MTMHEFIPPEIEQYKGIEALLVHVMGTEDSEEKIHLRGKSIIWAAEYLAYALEIPYLFFAGQHTFFGPEGEPLAWVTAREAINDLFLGHIHTQVVVNSKIEKPDKQGILRAKPVIDTDTELQRFIQFATDMKIGRVGSVSSKTHLPRLRRRYRQADLDASVIAAEDVLAQIPGDVNHNVYGSVIEQIRQSTDEKSFRRRENLTRALDLLPAGVGGYLLHQKAKSERTISKYTRDVTTET